MAELRVGTCSWADEALSKYFYPPGLPAGERLAHYAREFDTKQPGNANAGHEFGTTLSEDDKKALLLYLKNIR